MSTIVEKAQHILDEKNSKIIPENIKNNVQIFDVTGSLEEGIDTSDATATADDIVEYTSAYVDGVKIEGNIYDWRYQSGFEDFTNLQVEDMSQLNLIQTTCDVDLPQGYNSVVLTNNMEIAHYIPYNDLATAIELTANKIATGNTILGITGTGGGTDTSDATATANDIVSGTTAYVDGVKLSGTIIDERSECSYSNFTDITVHDSTSVHQLLVNGNLSNTAYGSGEGIVFDKGAILCMQVPYNDIATEIGLTANKIVQGNTILGVAGIASASGIDTSDATATANDLIAGTTAYVDGVKLEGTIYDNRDTSGFGDFKNIAVFENKSLGILEISGNFDDLPVSASSIALDVDVEVGISATYADVANEIGLTANKIKQGETILGVTGTFRGTSNPGNSDLIFVEPGSVICLDLHQLSEDLEEILDAETKALLSAYDTGNLTNFTMKFCDTIDSENKYNHSGIGLVINSGVAYIDGFNWDQTTGQSVSAFAKFVDLVSGSWPISSSFTVGSLINNIYYLDDYSGEIEIEYPANLPPMVLFNNKQVQITIDRGNGLVEPLTIDIPNTFIRITTGC